MKQKSYQGIPPEIIRVHHYNQDYLELYWFALLFILIDNLNIRGVMSDRAKVMGEEGDLKRVAKKKPM